jgi:hypothetical protein
MDFARKRLGITPKLKDQKLSGRLACKPKIVSVRRKVFGLFKVGKRGEPELVEKVAAPTMAAAVPILADGYGININPHKIRRHIHRTEGGYFCLQILWKS